MKPTIRDFQEFLTKLKAFTSNQESSTFIWSEASLKGLFNDKLANQEIIVISNREPYIHTRTKNGEIHIQKPASGLVTALEPIVRACSGTWIAHGSGDADKAAVDEFQRVMVPPDNPAFTIKRIWLSEAEEKGYYYGFANEGLWPLCHIAHVRPTFRSSDWDSYREINQRFALAAAAEKKTSNPLILIQDYHFALLPRLLRELIPDATIITFWHIPWPNPETFGICPWREQILDGLLGSSILGFHTQFHCNNFFDAVDRYIEARIDRETFTSWYKGEPTSITAYPISIAWPNAHIFLPKQECLNFVRYENFINSNCLIGVGVDRLDYTKGVIERFLALERLFELEPQWIGRFTFIQIAAPTRTQILHYQQLELEVEQLAERINQRFGNQNYQPICLRIRHHDATEINMYYRAANICCVSSLHDGMNLVAKEFISTRDDESGVLILSQFTGAARELTDAIIINPYYIDQCARAFALALTMPESEQQERMQNLRVKVQENNVYRWAGTMLLDATRIRQIRAMKDNCALTTE